MIFKCWLRHLSHNSRFVSKRSAHFLPESFYCHEKWDESLTDNVMQFKLKSYMESISSDFNANRKVTATRMDLLASKLMFAETIDELIWAEDLLKSFRNTTEYLKIPDSLSHGLLRSYIDVQQTARLIDILLHKKKFGIFVNDEYSANLLIDSLLSQDNWKGALRVSAEMALQEEEPREGTILSWLSLYSLFLNLKHTIKSICDMTNHVEANDEDDENVEQVKVHYKPNFTYDSHFDIRDDKLLAGKLLSYFLPALEKKVPRIEILAFALMENTKKCLDYIEDMEKNQSLRPSTLKVIESFITKGPMPFPKIHGNNMVPYPTFLWNQNENNSTEMTESLKNRLEQLNVGVITAEDAFDDIEQILKICHDELQDKIKDAQYDVQVKNFLNNVDIWRSQRIRRVNEDEKRQQLKAKRDSLLNEIEKLETSEEHLTFFDNRNIIEMYNKDSQFADESPLLVEIHGEKEFNEKYRKFYRLHKLDPIYYVVHRTVPRPEPPRFRVGAIEYEKLEYVKLKHVEPEPERIM